MHTSKVHGLMESGVDNGWDPKIDGKKGLEYSNKMDNYGEE